MKKWAYYNEIDPKACAWLKELMANGLITQGEIDNRSINEVKSDDLKPFLRAHFFAGIAGWDLALKLAGWPEDRPVWTGSCPCQPFSCAGKGLAESDERHLWPAFRELIRACQPATVFGEQVASKLGRDWLAGVFADLEGMGYSRAGADLCAAGVGAPHIRQRLYWVAHSNQRGWAKGNPVSRPSTANVFSGQPSQNSVGLAFPQCPERRANQPANEHDGCDARRNEAASGIGACGESGGVADTEHAERRTEHQINGEPHWRNGSGQSGNNGGMDNAEQPGLEGHTRNEHHRNQPRRNGAQQAGPASTAGTINDFLSSSTAERAVSNCRHTPGSGCKRDRGNVYLEGSRGVGVQFSAEAQFWSDAIWHTCRDGKARRISPEPAFFPLAHGLPGRVGLLRGYGNAIVPQVAAEFIKAYREAIED